MSDAHTQRAHARLSPSSAYRWMACPGSIRMSEGIEDRTSSYAAEGTACHELAAHCLERGFDPQEFLGWTIDTAPPEGCGVIGSTRPVDGVTRFEVDEEMVEAVALYIEHIRDLLPTKGEYELDVEQRLDMTHIHPEIYGTGDVVLYQVDEARLHVIDLKYGKGVAVDPRENPQLMLYGAGAVRRYHNRPLREIVLHIVQPRAPHVRGPVRSWTTDPLTLMEFEDDLRVLAERTEAATRAFHSARPQKSNAPWERQFLTPGEHCRFCKAAPTCPALREQSLADAMAEFADDGEVVLRPVETLSVEDRVRVFKATDRLANWIKAVQEFEHAEAVAGRGLPGFKLVAKRAMRKWKDEAEVKAVLSDEYLLGAAETHSEPKLLSPAQIEKVVGKKNFGALEGLVVKQSSGTNLVPESDPRPAVTADAASEFAED